ncbi:MAG: hypothetical protein LH624_08340 [Cryobacterium sp.]|nr:hypothetical protein [Cryobacterium sp.]
MGLLDRTQSDVAPEWPQASGCRGGAATSAQVAPHFGCTLCSLAASDTGNAFERIATAARTARHHTKDDDHDAVDELPLLGYLLESGSDRIGGLDFQESAAEYVPRTRDHNASLEDPLSAADDIAAGRPVPLAMDNAILHGTSIRGARPKALINDGEDQLIAKFSTTTDSYPMARTWPSPRT